MTFNLSPGVGTLTHETPLTQEEESQDIKGKKSPPLVIRSTGFQQLPVRQAGAALGHGFGGGFMARTRSVSNLTLMCLS